MALETQEGQQIDQCPGHLATFRRLPEYVFYENLRSAISQWSYFSANVHWRCKYLSGGSLRRETIRCGRALRTRADLRVGSLVCINAHVRVCGVWSWIMLVVCFFQVRRFGGGVKFQRRAYAGRGQKERLVRVGTASVGTVMRAPITEPFSSFRFACIRLLKIRGAASLMCMMYWRKLVWSTTSARRPLILLHGSRAEAANRAEENELEIPSVQRLNQTLHCPPTSPN